MAHPDRGRDHDDHSGDGHADRELLHPGGGADRTSPNQAGHTRDVGALNFAVPAVLSAITPPVAVAAFAAASIANDNPMKISFKERPVCSRCVFVAVLLRHGSRALW